MTPTRDGRPWLLAIDTGTSKIVIAAGSVDGRVLAAIDEPAGHRHGERLLAGVERLVGAAHLDLRALAGIVVGIGPGAFTGLRVGLATAKTLAHARGLPIAGIGTGEALLRAAETDPGERSTRRNDLVLLLPAGPHDRLEVRPGRDARLLPGGMEPDLGPSDVLVAVDLAGRAPQAAVASGERALAGLAAALVELGARRLAAGFGDDPARLVPEYVSLPRGVRVAGGEIEWSHGPR
ncbi:MAG: tRNA (adenosine(37)-N6)-threonylcarbamoyltransferase complex dimerization subunit type 1 TsaB [Chloroflexota bacterium]